MKHIQNLNLTAHVTGDSKEDTQLDVSMWHSDQNICEMKPEVPYASHEACITEHGIYFGTEDEREPTFCPKHYFEDTGYTIEPLETKE